MKFPITIIIINLVVLVILSRLSFQQVIIPPNSEWLSGKSKEGIDVPEPGGNWRSRPKCMTSRPYYVGYGRYLAAVQGADCVSLRRDDAWINDFNVTVPFPVIGQVAMEIVRGCSDHHRWVNGEEDFIIWGKRLTVIIAWRDCPGDPDW